MQETTQTHQPENDIENEPKSSDSFTRKEKLILGGIVLVLIWIFIAYDSYSRKCGNCKEWSAMKKIRKKLISTKSTWITETNNGQERSVPGTMFFYEVRRKCKHCGYEDYVEEQEKRKD